jgi:alkylation response protein AidB-like acyl-CoA dehydrogenase
VSHPALTQLSEEELLFRDSVLDFAKKRVAPHVAAMDDEGRPRLFELGLMGIEVPEEYGGAASSFFNAILAVEALAVVDPSVSVLVDVQNTLVANALLRWGTEAQKAKYLPEARERVGGLLRPQRARLRLRRLRARAPRRAQEGRPLGAQRPESSGSPTPARRTSSSSSPTSTRQGLQGHHRLPRRARLPRLLRGQEGGQARHPRLQHLRARPRGLFVPEANVLGEVGKGYKIAIETLNEGRIGIGAQMLGLAQGAFDYAMRYMAERKQFGSAIADFQGVQFQYARSPWRSRPRGCWSTTPPA